MNIPENKKNFSITFSKDTYNVLESISEKTKVSKSDILEQAFKHFVCEAKLKSRLERNKKMN